MARLSHLALLAALFVVGLQGASAAPSGPGVAGSVYRYINRTASLTTLKRAVVAANLTAALSDSKAKLTCFLPTNKAFTDLIKGTGVTLAELLADKAALSDVLLYHCTGRIMRKAALKNGMNVTMLNSQNVTVIKSGTAWLIRDALDRAATITLFDTVVGAGIAHTINGVLVPNFP